MTDDMYIVVSLEASEDGPVADILYRGVQWASLTAKGGEDVLTLHATAGAIDLPVDVALASIAEARRRLR